MRPDAALLALRPAVPTETDPAEATGSVGAFLHATLRPVLKLQNELLLALVADFVADHRIALASAEATQRQRLLTQLLERNTKLRATIVGLVAGHFTAPEYAFYQLNRSELNRRILDLATQRVVSQL